MKNKSILGMKFDKHKLKWGLLPYDALQEIVKVLTFGALKYAPDNWKYVKDGKIRYFDALMRHLVEWKESDYGKDQKRSKDSETGLSHLAHAGACILFLIWYDLMSSQTTNEKKINKGEKIWQKKNL